MQRIKNIKKAWFVGIGGIGMSALARYFLHQGIKVGGYDRVQSEISRALSREGAYITNDERISSMWEDIDLLVYTPAVPASHPQISRAEEKGIPVKKRAEILGDITREPFTIAVAGTHGKTSISTLIAHLLRSGSIRAGAFLGGISGNFNGNFVPAEENILVVEADEYDRSFLHLHPDLAVISAIDPDHLDVYGDLEHLQAAYNDFAALLSDQGLLIIKRGLKLPAYSGTEVKEYALDAQAPRHAANIHAGEGAYRFDFVSPGLQIEGLELAFPGIHNVENAVAAIVVALEMGVSADDIRRALPRFKGIKRRFEYRLKQEDIVFIDDYAHHPKEIELLIRSVREMYPTRSLTLVFQPHLYSRTRDLAAEFARVLGDADELILLPVYPAREEPIPGVSSRLIADKLPAKSVHVIEKSDLIDTLLSLKPGLLLTAGAGDIDRELPAIEEALKNRTL